MGIKHYKYSQDELAAFLTRGGVLYASDVLAWLPKEKTTIEVSKACWNAKWE